MSLKPLHSESRLLEEDPGSISMAFEVPTAVDGGLEFRRRAWETGLPRVGEELKTYHRSLLHALAAAARMEAEFGIHLLPDDEKDPEEFRSYHRLYKDVRQLAAVLHEEGLRPGDRVVLLLPTGFEFITSFLAIQLAGAVPVPCYPPALLENAELALQRMEQITRHSGARAFITRRDLLALVGGLALKCKSLEQMWLAETLMAQTPRKPWRWDVRGRDAAFIQYTSGSTGTPKGVELTHRNLVANVHAAGQACQINRNDKMVSWLPLYHDMGLIGGLLFSIYWKMPFILMSPLAFLSRPVRWLQTFGRYRATLTAAPNFAYGMCVKRVRPSEREGLDLSTWRLALNGAEPVSAVTARDFAKTFGPHGYRESVMYPCYGLAEASVAVTFPPPSQGALVETVDRTELAQGRAVLSDAGDAVQLVSNGYAVPGHELQVVDPEGRVLEDRRVGEIYVRGPSVMRGYYGDAERTQDVLQGGWLRTGDLGYFTERGLFVTGRAKDLIIVRGKNFYAEDVERVAEGVEGARPSGAVAFGLYDSELARDRVVLVCETRLTSNEERVQLTERLGERIRDEVGLQLDEVCLVAPGTLPRTSSGKRQRRATRERYLGGTLRPQKTALPRVAWMVARSAAGYFAAWNRARRRSE